MASVFVLLEAFNRKEAAALGFFPCATAPFGFYASEAQAGRVPTGLPQSPVPPLNSFHTVFHSDVENSYFSTVHNRLYKGQK